jgi:TolB-like protein/Tfp pilus assembly protein PilF
MADGRSPALEGWDNRKLGEDRKAIAVLPFVNMSGDPANEPFTLGIHDDLLTHLSRIKSLKTTSRTSVLRYRGTTMSVPEIGAELNVNFILEGGIQRAGDRVRINLQLIDVATDEHLWAEIYDRQLSADNLFGVQADIAREVSSSLKATLLPDEAEALAVAPTRSMAAYDLYLLGRHHQQLRTEESINRAVDYFTRAIEEDPDYVLAHAGLAQSRLLLIGYGNLRGAEVLPQARETIDRAMAIDDSEAELWAALGLYLIDTGENQAALDALERAIELDMQNFHAWLWYANALGAARRFEEQLESLLVAYDLEPMSYPVNVNLGGVYRRRGELVRARHHFDRADQVDEQDLAQWQENIVDSYFQGGDFSRGIIEARNLLASNPGSVNAIELLVLAYVEFGDFAEARRWVSEAAKIDAFDTSGQWLFLAQDDYDAALADLEDKRALLQAEGDEFIFELFEAAYLGGQIESARDYLNRFLNNRGGRMEVNPAQTWQWNNLLVADFLLRHGADSPGGERRGQEMLREATQALLALTEQGYRHPNTWAGLAMAQAMSGNTSAALVALGQAVDAGYRWATQLERYPQFASLRSQDGYRDQLKRIKTALAEDQASLATVELANYSGIDSRERVVLPRALLEQYAGYYTDGNIIFQLYVDEQGQFNGVPGTQRAMPLIPFSETEFYVELVQGITLKIERESDGSVAYIEVFQGGGVQRLKKAAPPPEAIELEREQLLPFTGTWAARMVEGNTDEGADTDTWTAVIAVEDGALWLDFDNQPRLSMVPYEGQAFFVRGFIQRFRFEQDPAGDAYTRMVMLRDGTELVFERQLP